MNKAPPAGSLEALYAVLVQAGDRLLQLSKQQSDLSERYLRAETRGQFAELREEADSLHQEIEAAQRAEREASDRYIAASLREIEEQEDQ